MFSFSFTPTVDEYIKLDIEIYKAGGVKRQTVTYSVLVAAVLCLGFSVMAAMMQLGAVLLIGALCILIVEVVLFVLPVWKTLLLKGRERATRRTIGQQHLTGRVWTFEDNKITISSDNKSVVLNGPSVRSVYQSEDGYIFLDDAEQYRFLPLRAIGGERVLFDAYLRERWAVSQWTPQLPSN